MRYEAKFEMKFLHPESVTRSQIMRIYGRF